MSLLLINDRIRRNGIALAAGSILLLGCARKVQFEIPQGFHGHVRIQCTGLTDDRTTTIRINETGQIAAATCPTRQTDSVVTRAGTPGAVDASIMWTTTGDGLVREIAFDVK